MKKALLLGDYTNYAYHKLGGVDTELCSILKDVCEINCTEDYNELLNIADYDLFISYTDKWRGEIISDEQIASIVTYVANGGAMLIIHNGISLQVRKEFMAIAGGKFYHHPKMESITMRKTDIEDEITADLNEYEMVDEPYQFEFDPFANVTMLTEYVYQGNVYPSSWKNKYCKGNVVYLMNGHTSEHFKNEEYRKFIKNSAIWLLKQGA